MQFVFFLMPAMKMYVYTSLINISNPYKSVSITLMFRPMHKGINTQLLSTLWINLFAKYI